jgi:iron complex transport system permease protein
MGQQLGASKFNNYFRYYIVFIFLICAFFFAIVLNINSGSVDISIPDMISILFRGPQNATTDYNIVWKIRLPRLLTAAVLGGALSISGFLLQTFFRNPIAGPFVLGIASGAKTMVALLMLGAINFWGAVSNLMMIGAAFIGSILAMGFVLLMSRKIKSMSMLLVAGIMIGYICSAFTNFLVAFANEYEISNLYTWSLGSFSGASWDTLKIASIIVFVTVIIVFLLAKPIGAYQLGEAYAQSMGVNIRVFRVVLIILSSILSACVTAFVGPISFVGIAVPHITKMLLKTSKPIVVIPAAFLCGSTFCMLCDLIARTVVSPSELTISTVTAIFGAPIVIGLMIKRQGNGR